MKLIMITLLRTLATFWPVVKLKWAQRPYRRNYLSVVIRE